MDEILNLTESVSEGFWGFSYLLLDIITKLKFTTNFDRCAILNVLNYLTKNSES